MFSFYDFDFSDYCSLGFVSGKVRFLNVFPFGRVLRVVPSNRTNNNHHNEPNDVNNHKIAEKLSGYY